MAKARVTKTSAADGTAAIPRHGWGPTAVDRWLLGKLRPHLPEQIFDAHMHLYRCRDFANVTELMQHGPAEAGLAQWRAQVGAMFGGEQHMAGALVLPFPTVDADVHEVNQWVSERVAGAADARMAVLVDPALPADAYDYLYERPEVAGFKVYHIFARDRAPRNGGKPDTMQAGLGEFLPEWIWEQAHDRRWFIMLHIVKSRALADPDNQQHLRAHCERYPQARLILAHAGRGFHGPDTTDGIGAIAGLPNVWFDTSAICEPEPFLAILKEFGPRRLMYGSDFPVSALRGRAVSAGDGFAWLQTDRLDWQEAGFFGQPAQLGLEGIQALVQALRWFHADQEDRADVFCHNGQRLLGLREDDPQTGHRWYVERALPVVAGGTQLLSKNPDTHVPGLWPPYFREARGCEITDEGGRRWIDIGHHGIGACALGYRDPDVTEAVLRRVSLGSYSILNHKEEFEVAELLCELHPWAQKVRYARSGGETMAVAARIARATTGRSLIAICGYHGWHDWYLAANLGESDALAGHLLPGLDPAGVPAELRGTTLTFRYDDPEAFSSLIASHGDALAAVIMEPVRRTSPQPGFLELVRDECHRVGALLVFDEISIGWRLARGGAHLRFGVQPDIAAFAKALGSGHPMGAVIGTDAAMKGYYDSFISSTSWTEGVGFVAAKATLQKMMRIDLPAHCDQIGRQVVAAWLSSAERHGVPLRQDGDLYGFPGVAFDHPQAAELVTLYNQLMLDHGFLAATTMFICYAHTEREVAAYAAAMDSVMAELAAAIDAGDITARLAAGKARAGFSRLN